MDSRIKTIEEGKRGCGYRKKGGIYLRSDKPGISCGKLPVELGLCPHCGQGHTNSRHPKWIDGAIIANSPCRASEQYCGQMCGGLSAIQPGVKVLLIWIGERHYKTPAIFNEEAKRMGISRRIKSVPHDFELGETWVAFAHSNCIPDGEDDKGRPLYRKGIFKVFKPERIEVVCDGTEDAETIDRYEERGLTPVKVVNSSPVGAPPPPGMTVDEYNDLVNE
jgi:hypothetical protein